MAVVVSELERVLEQVGYGRREKLSVCFDDNAILGPLDRQLLAAGLRFNDGRDF